MNATWGLRRHVALGIQRLLCSRHGALPAWQMVRLLWLSGAMDGREVAGPPKAEQLAAGRRRGLEMLAGGHCFVDPSSDNSMERLVRTWPELVELCRQRQR